LSLWTNVRDSFTGHNDGGLFGGSGFMGLNIDKGLDNFSHNVLEPLGGGFLENLGISGHGPAKWYEEPGRGPGDYNSSAAIGLSRQMIPNRQNPLLGGFASRMRSATAGMNPAAQAAAQQMGRQQAAQGLSTVAPDYWQRLMSLAVQTSNAQQGIPTTSTTNAALTGFTQGGGIQGITDLVRLFGG